MIVRTYSRWPGKPVCAKDAAGEFTTSHGLLRVAWQSEPVHHRTNIADETGALLAILNNVLPQGTGFVNEIIDRLMEGLRQN